MVHIIRAHTHAHDIKNFIEGKQQKAFEMQKKNSQRQQDINPHYISYRYSMLNTLKDFIDGNGDAIRKGQNGSTQTIRHTIPGGSSKREKNSSAKDI